MPPPTPIIHRWGRGSCVTTAAKKTTINLPHNHIYKVFTWRHGGHVEGVNKETVAMLEEWNILLGIEVYFYANSSFCFIMQIWLLVTWANTLYTLTELLRAYWLLKNLWVFFVPVKSYWHASYDNAKDNMNIDHCIKKRDIFSCNSLLLVAVVLFVFSQTSIVGILPRITYRKCRLSHA